MLDGTANVTCKQEPGALLFEYEVDAKETRGTVADRHVGNDAMLSHPPMDDPASPEPVVMDAEYHRMLAGFQR
ncbi:hypothetical protein ACFSUD_01760 [Sulfitobacter aestuarii]|uniref:Uncharacterized protein n=1 Tax=Sulfitobacter aestuarii TaxID=2161676 RepID=A0ABW5TXC3_9RHOB